MIWIQVFQNLLDGVAFGIGTGIVLVVFIRALNP
jgi:hypothetical protein